MLKIDLPIVVEGKYDKIKLSSVVDGVIIETMGFGIFKNPELKEYLKRVSHEKGIIVLTDSDRAGGKIRNYIKSFCGEGALIYNVYVPEIKGKERRKEKFSSAGLLGVEGIEKDVIEKSLLRFCSVNENRDERKITVTDFFEAGLTGKSDSASRRKRLLKKLGLPTSLNSNSLLKVLNTNYSYDEALKIIREETTDVND